MSRIGGGPDRPKRDISPEMRRGGVEARRVDGGGKARERRGDDGKWSAVGDGKGKKRAREGRPQKLPILLGFARTRTRQGPRGQVGPVGKCVRRTILVGLHGFTQGRPNFYFSLSLRALELNLNIPYY